MSTIFTYTGLAFVLGVPALFSGDLVQVAGGVCLIVGAVIAWFGLRRP